MFNNLFFPEIVPFMRYVEKYCRAGHDIDDNMAHGLCILDTLGYKHTLTICNTYCFSTATMVAI